MPKTSSTRTFAGCWTCRRRNVRCDTLKPKCSACKRSHLVCEGYHIRLVWVDPVSGDYTPCQRRSYPSHLTWANRPEWSSTEIDHLISQCEPHRCHCRLHQFGTPFSSFQYHTRRGLTDAHQCDFGLSPSDEGSLASAEYPSIDSHYSTVFSDTSDDIDATPLADLESSNSTSPHSICLVKGQDRSNDQWAISPRLKMTNVVDLDEIVDVHQELEKEWSTISSLPQMTTSDKEEVRFLHHYILHVSSLMVPVDAAGNPWKSTYLAIGAQKATPGARALYYATLAQGALHLAHLKGPRQGHCEKAQAIKYIGVAISKLRNSLSSLNDDYTSVLAALLSLIAVQHVFQNNSHGWREHYRGAVGFVSQYLQQRPWSLSWDAWIVTQSFVLGVIFAETANDSAAVIDKGASPVRNLLTEMMTEPRLGCTVGGNARHLVAIYQIRLLEAQIARSGSTELQDMSPAMLERVCQIIQQLEVFPDDQRDAHQSPEKEFESDTPSPTQTLVKLHSQIFDGAVMIHLCRVVLQCPPSAVTSYVHQVLASVVKFMEGGGGQVSAWPVFIAAVEACTDEDQRLASRYFCHTERVFAGNRTDMHCVARQVWADRESLALKQHCDAGDIRLDWRDVKRRLGIDILLL